MNSRQVSRQAKNLIKGIEQSLDDYCVFNDEGKAVSRMAKTALELFGNAEQLSSAQPEIVRCKECKWYELPSHKITENCVRWMKSNGILLPIKPNDYCSYAERRTDDGD